MIREFNKVSVLVISVCFKTYFLIRFLRKRQNLLNFLQCECVWNLSCNHHVRWTNFGRLFFVDSAFYVIGVLLCGSLVPLRGNSHKQLMQWFRDRTVEEALNLEKFFLYTDNSKGSTQTNLLISFHFLFVEKLYQKLQKYNQRTLSVSFIVILNLM